MKKILVLLLVLALVFAACTPASNTNTDDKPSTGTEDKKPEDGKTEGDKQEEPKANDIVARSKGITSFDYNTSTPATLGSHDTLTADANFITNYTTMGFYGIKANDAGDGFEFTSEMAAEFPVDVTSQYAGNATYGVPADAKEFYAWAIKLNPDAKWEDGTPITADDYMYSYKNLIAPEMKNQRANEVYTGHITLANAEAYYKQGTAYEDIVGNEEKAEQYGEENFFISMTEAVYFFGAPAKQYYENPSYADAFKAADGTDLYAKYAGSMYVPLTEEAKADLNTIASNFGDTNPEAWKEFCLVKTENPPVDFETVGMKKINDYEIHFILGAPTNDFFIKYGLTSNWLVKEDLYENNKTKTGDIVKTSYGSDNTKYASFGPYKISEYIRDKLVVLTMNENWYGWTDGKHEYMSNVEKIRYDIIPEYETAFQKFLAGELDSISIASGKEEYAASPFLFSSPAQYTYNLNFHVNRENLRGFEEPGINKTMLSYKKFRQAISMGLNRVEFNRAMGPLNKPIAAMLNEIYITDPYTGQSYRESEQGKKVLMDLYGGLDVDAGYDVAKARELAMEAYEEAKANGDYKDGDVIVVKYPRAVDNERGKLLMSTIENAVLEVLKGTPLEGKFKVEVLVTDEWNAKMQSGEAQVSMSGGGGGAMDPFGLMEFNIRPGKTYGIDYSKIDLTLTVDGKEVTKDLYTWITGVTDGEYRTADNELKTTILAAVETRTLQEYASIPVQSSSSDSLLSMRIRKQLDKYVPLVGFGETYYDMTDAEWAEYVKANLKDGILDYK